jgi:chemotaxis protein MotB
MSRPRKKAAKPEEHHVDERWLVSYSDMVTVLFCLFVVLFAMSSTDQAKYEKLKSSLATGFGVTETDKIDVTDGLIVPPDKVNDNGEQLTDMKAAAAEVDDLNAIENAVKHALADKGLASAANFGMDPRGLTIHMTSSAAFFDPDNAQLKNQAIQILDAVAPSVKASGRQLSVEGHTAKQPGAPRVRDWELSTERAVTVVRHLVDANGIGPKLIGATGYGESRPLIDGVAPGDMVQNRRVDVVVLSNKSETVRALIPAAEAEKAAAPASKESGH